MISTFEQHSTMTNPWGSQFLEKLRSRLSKPLSSKEAFVAKLAQHTASILAAPNSIRHDTKTQAIGVIRRRSRIIAGARAECNLNELETRSRKKVMRALSIINEQGGITDQASEEYLK
jgi:hypothetical protein